MGWNRRSWLAIAVALAAATGAFSLWWQVLGTAARQAPVGVLLALTLGVNVTIWVSAGGLRWIDEALNRRWPRNYPVSRRRIGRASRQRSVPPRILLHWPGDHRAGRHGDVAIVIPAHNEEPVIGQSIASATQLLPARDVYVVSDGSSDRTTLLAAMTGVNVLDLRPNRGKAGALEAALEHFRLTERYEAVLFLDADSRLDRTYLERIRPLLLDPEIAAIAGYAVTIWAPKELSLLGQFIVAYRDRLYILQQRLYKFGQSWHRLNVAYIAPGFASVYRSRTLRGMEMNPPGLVIEDFNMTFQVHRRRLGRIAFSPAIRAAAQDPHSLRDYIHQVRRWNLGFWQTIRYNGVWPSLFWLALALVIAESMLVNFAILSVLLLAIGLALPVITDGAVLEWHSYSVAYSALEVFMTLPVLAVAVLVPDYLLTCVVAAVRRRPRYLVLGLGFVLLRAIDATLALWTLPQAWRTTSTGAWRSPARR